MTEHQIEVPLDNQFYYVSNEDTYDTIANTLRIRSHFTGRICKINLFSYLDLNENNIKIQHNGFDINVHVQKSKPHMDFHYDVTLIDRAPLVGGTALQSTAIMYIGPVIETKNNMIKYI